MVQNNCKFALQLMGDFSDTHCEHAHTKTVNIRLRPTWMRCI